jgi:hypothetical protein
MISILKKKIMLRSKSRSDSKIREIEQMPNIIFIDLRVVISDVMSSTKD